MTTTIHVGWVLHSSTVGFAVGCRVLQPNVPQFGDLVKVPLLPDEIDIFGLIYNVQAQGDPVVRQLIMADNEIEPEAVLDQRENRLVPIEISVLIVGFRKAGRIIQGLPPQPPVSLDTLVMCENDDIMQFTSHLDYIRLVLNTPQLPTDELLVANLQQATTTRPYEIQHQFLLVAGRELARLLSFDLIRLDSILKRLRPLNSSGDMI